MANNEMMGQWIDELVGSVGEFTDLETTDGVRREGRISGFQMKKMVFNGIDVDIPIEVELNGDPNDRIPISRIGKINIK